MSASGLEPSVEIPRHDVIETGGVVRSGAVVILRESELDCELGEAIERVRSDKETRGSRILIIGADQDAVDTLDVGSQVPAMPASPTHLARMGEPDLLRRIGSQLARLSACWERFDRELGAELEEFGEAIGDEPLARLQARLGRLKSIQEWQGAVRAAMEDEAADLCAGRRDISLEEALVEAVQTASVRFPGVRILRAPGGTGDVGVRAPAATLVEVLYLALGLTAQRIGGRGRVHLDPVREDGVLRLEIAGDGEPRPVVAPEWIERLKSLVEKDLEGRILPGSHGVHAAGMILELPRAHGGH